MPLPPGSIALEGNPGSEGLLRLCNRHRCPGTSYASFQGAHHARLDLDRIDSVDANTPGRTLQGRSPHMPELVSLPLPPNAPGCARRMPAYAEAMTSYNNRPWGAPCGPTLCERGTHYTVLSRPPGIPPDRCLREPRLQGFNPLFSSILATGNAHCLLRFAPGWTWVPIRNCVGGLHHLALSMAPEQWDRIKTRFDAAGVTYQQMGRSLSSSDPAGTRLECSAIHSASHARQTHPLRAGLRLQGIGLRVWGLALEDAEHVLHRHDRLALDALIGA